MLRGVLVTLGVCSPLGAQALGAGYQIARANQIDMRQASGPGLRLRFRVPIDLRYDYLVTDGQRFDTPCGGFIPPNCPPETINSSSRLHSVFIAARARLLSRGSFHLFALPEVGFVSGTILKRGVASGRGTSATGGGLGAGAAVELFAARVGGTPIGGWVAARFRGFVHPGAYAVDGYEPHRELDWIRSVEFGVTFSLQSPRVKRRRDDPSLRARSARSAQDDTAGRFGERKNVVGWDPCAEAPARPRREP